MTVNYRKYDSYEAYVKHQSAKLSLKDRSLRRNFQKHVKKFREIFSAWKRHIKGKDVLCLGARSGAEVKAFRDLGFKGAIGIDLNPGEDNQYVVKGDFHDIPFPDSSFDAIFSNSMDHCFNLSKITSEAERVLREPQGVCILTIQFMTPLDDQLTKWESAHFDDVHDVTSLFDNMEVIESITDKTFYTEKQALKRQRKESALVKPIVTIVMGFKGDD